jgi:hypothetical protein
MFARILEAAATLIRSWMKKVSMLVLKNKKHKTTKHKTHKKKKNNNNKNLVSELVETTLSSQLSFPVRAIGRSSCHCAQQLRIDFDDLLHVLRANVAAHRRSRIHCNNHAPLKTNKREKKKKKKKKLP